MVTLPLPTTAPDGVPFNAAGRRFAGDHVRAGAMRAQALSTAVRHRQIRQVAAAGCPCARLVLQMARSIALFAGQLVNQVQEMAARRGCAGSTTMSKVAMGPRRNEIRNQKRPLRPLPCARPALIRVNVPQPTT